jgi:hypothetical protein
MRHVQYIDILASKRKRDADVMHPERFFFGLIELLEIGRQWPKLVKVSMRANQQILVSQIDRRKIPDEVPDIGSNTEFVDFADVDRDSHGIGKNGVAAYFKPRPHFSQL